MDAAHHLVLLAGVPELPSIFAGLFSARFGTPILLVFLAIGMLFGKEGPVSLVFNCTQTAYLIGSAALAVNPSWGAQDEAQHAQNRVWPAGAAGPAGVVTTLRSPVTQQNRSSATRAIDNSLHGTFLHW